MVCKNTHSNNDRIPHIQIQYTQYLLIIEKHSGGIDIFFI